MKVNALNGIIPVRKEPGMTSHDVVAKIRKLLMLKKVGHTGTLDPEVEGVLPICLGQATKLSNYIMELPKSYHGQLKIGISTTTQDFTGEIIEEKKVSNLSEEEIDSVFKSFIGEIEQIPPMYSSIKIKGKKLYELARQGKEVERKPRKVTIYDLQVTGFDLNKNDPTIDFNVSCSKGTYIRTLCVDIGERLGYPAHMSKLIRTKSGSFTLKESYTLSEIEDLIQDNKIHEILIPMAKALPHLKEVVLSEEEIESKVYNGKKLFLNTLSTHDGVIKIVNETGELIALYETQNNDKKAIPKRVFKM